jgi:hypothetical protein
MPVSIDDELYGVALDQFTPTRDALAVRLKAEGKNDEAAEIKRARKPSVPAWAVNQVVWHAREEWDRLRAAAEALRRQHQEGGSREELARLTREQRDALVAAEGRAAEQLAQHGHAASPSVLQKVSHTLLAIAYGSAGAVPGRLERELSPPGFEVVAGLTLAPAAPASDDMPEVSRATKGKSGGAPAADRRAADEEARARAARRAARKEAQAREAEARRALEKARARFAEEDERRRALERQLDAARRTSEAAAREVEKAEAELAEAQAAREAVERDAGD